MSLGYIAPYKGLEFIAQVLELSTTPIPILFIGGTHRVLSSDPSFSSWLSDLSAELTRRGVTFAGYVKKTDLWPLLAEAKVGVLTYRSTSGGTAAFATLASAGLPVVATDTKEFRWLESLGAGILIVEGGPVAFRAKLEGILADDVERGRLREKQMDYARNFSLAKFCGRITQLVATSSSPNPPANEASTHHVA